MRVFNRISEQKLAQIALQTANFIEFPTICANFGDVRQRSQLNAVIPPFESRYYPIPGFFFNSVNVLSAVTMGECSYSPIDLACTSRSLARQIEYSRHANAK